MSISDKEKVTSPDDGHYAVCTGIHLDGVFYRLNGRLLDGLLWRQGGFVGAAVGGDLGQHSISVYGDDYGERCAQQSRHDDAGVVVAVHHGCF